MKIKDIESIKKRIDETIKENQKGVTKIQAIISKGGNPKNENCTPMYQGTATNRLAVVDTKKINVTKMSERAVLQEQDFEIFFDNYVNLKAGLRVSTQKLLNASIIEFTKANSYKSEKLKLEVKIPLVDYVKKLGYDLTPKQCKTEEEEEKERKRIENIINGVRRTIADDLKTLFSMSLSWREPSKSKKGEMRDYKDIRLIQSKGVRAGIITIEFSNKIAEYLNQSYITNFPLALLGVDNRNPIAYQIGYKLAYHYGLESNKKKKTNNIIKVGTLIKNLGELKTYEEIGKTDPGHWGRRIKEPIERALDHLVTKKVLKTWEYSKTKKNPLSDNEIESGDFSVYEDLFIHFEMY